MASVSTSSAPLHPVKHDDVRFHIGLRSGLWQLASLHIHLWLQGCQVGGGLHPTRPRLVAHGRRHGQVRSEGGGDLRLAAQGLGQHRPHPRRRRDLQGVHPGDAGRPRRHLRPASAQHRPRGRRRLPAGRRGVPSQGPRRRLLPLRLARVQLLHLRPSEERAGLGITAAELLGRQSRGDPERVGRVRRQPVAVPHPAGRGVSGHPLHQQARDLHQGTRAPEEVRRRRQPGRSGDQGAAQEDAPVAASFRAEAPGEACKICPGEWGIDASFCFLRWIVPVLLVLYSLDCLRRSLHSIC